MHLGQREQEAAAEAAVKAVKQVHQAVVEMVVQEDKELHIQ